MSEGTRLDSWKSIAHYLGRDVRTVIRWERDRHLPVHRVPGGGLPRVFAYAHELDEWLAAPGGPPNGEDHDAAASVHADGEPAAPRARAATVSRYVAVAAAGGLVAALAAFSAGRLASNVPAPQRLTIAGNAVQALDASGAEVWTYRFAGASELTAPNRWQVVNDLDADGRTDVVATVDLHGPGSGVFEGALHRFAGEGRSQWSAQVKDRLMFRGGEYGPPWVAADLTAFRVGADTRLAWTVHHFTWWPSLLVTLDARGERRGTFVNSGWITTVIPSRDGRHVLVGGVTNAWRAYFLAVLDADRPVGRSPEPPGSETECLACPAGDPLHYFVFPRTDVGRRQPFPGGGPAVQVFEDGRTQIQTIESSGPQIAAVIYDLQRDFTMPRARLSDSFWEWHGMLEAEGRLTHDERTCPMRGSLEVRHWTPAGGWRTELLTAD